LGNIEITNEDVTPNFFLKKILSLVTVLPEWTAIFYDMLIEDSSYDICALKETLGDEASNTVFVLFIRTQDKDRCVQQQQQQKEERYYFCHFSLSLSLRIHPERGCLVSQKQWSYSCSSCTLVVVVLLETPSLPLVIEIDIRVDISITCR
jgi:hypothetical protein